MTTITSILSSLTPDRRAVMDRLRTLCLTHLPDTQECIQYGMISYVAPFSLYPDGYHCDPSLPLPFVSIAVQKNFISLYHMGIYADPTLLEWFCTSYPQHNKRKLDMGKSCIRFKHLDDIPYDFLGQLLDRMRVQEWVTIYEKMDPRKK